jgi:hypothetical protein
MRRIPITGDVEWRGTRCPRSLHSQMVRVLHVNALEGIFVFFFFFTVKKVNLIAAQMRSARASNRSAAQLEALTPQVASERSPLHSLNLKES